MAGINFQNLVLPAANRVHLVSIILAIVLFAAFRLSGGGLDFENVNKTHHHQKKSDAAESEAVENANQQHHTPMNATHQKHIPMNAANQKHIPMNTANNRPNPQHVQRPGSVSRQYSGESAANSAYSPNMRRENINVDNVINTPAERRRQPGKMIDAFDEIEDGLGIR